MNHKTREIQPILRHSVSLPGHCNFHLPERGKTTKLNSVIFRIVFFVLGDIVFVERKKR